MEYIHDHISRANPDDLVTAMEALAAIDSKKSLDLLKRAAIFRLPELNMAYTKKMKGIVARAR